MQLCILFPLKETENHIIIIMIMHNATRHINSFEEVGNGKIM